MSSWVDAAAKSQLPPSPELKSTQNPNPSVAEGLSLRDGSLEQSSIAATSRLRAVANYGSFGPQALACSLPVASYYSEPDVLVQSSLPSSSTLTGRTRADLSAREQLEGHGSSLGAIAGLHGVSLFRVTKPHAPLLILGHASGASSSLGGVTSLAFQPQVSRAQSSLYLAAARGAGILLWDVSGHSLSPLTGRLGTDAGLAGGVDMDSRISDIAWYAGTDKNSATPLLVATTGSAACLWDLREPPRSTFNKPSVRFGARTRTSAEGTANIQVSCTENGDCGILDRSGCLRIFDIRMTVNSRVAAGALFSGNVFRHAGFGLEPFTMSSEGSSCWVCWGVDKPGSDAVVRVLVPGGKAPEPEQYWYMDGSPDRSVDISVSSKTNGYRMYSQVVPPGLACARVCPPIVKDAFVTVSVDNMEEGTTGWHAQLWKLKPSEGGGDSYFDNTVSFEGDLSAFSRQLPTFGDNLHQGVLCASEMAISSSESPRGSVRDEEETRPCLLLCSLTDTGYITTHAIPEAITAQGSDKYNEGASLAVSGRGSKSQARIFPPEKDRPVKDAAHAWNLPNDTMRKKLGNRSENRDLNQGTPTDGPQMPFDMDAPAAYSLAGVPEVPVGVVGGLPATRVPDEEEESTGRTKNNAIDAAFLMERIETDRIPCPRLCGATFGPGLGGLAVFNNGDVRKTWTWWEKSDPARPFQSSTTGPGLNLQDGLSVKATATTRDCPRTLQDLLNMAKAAKEAQWGKRDQDDSDASSVGFHVLDAKFFEDGSDGSSDSGDDESEDLTDGAKEMYDNYFSDSHRLFVDTSLTTRESTEQGSEERTPIDDHLGPSSDVRAPSVSVTNRFDRLSLNNQSIELAQRWKYRQIQVDQYSGNFDELPVPANFVMNSSPVETHSEELRPLSPSRRLGGLPRYRNLVPSSRGHRSGASAELGVPSLGPVGATRGPGISEDEEERGVHGGEYPVRPNMQESMVFLKKLFTHHQDSARPGRGALSPPDGPMLPNKRLQTLVPTFPGRDRLKNERSRSTLRPTGGVGVGVFTLQAHDHESLRMRLSEQAEIQKICEYNAEVCRSLGEIGKQQSWELIANAVRSGVGGDCGWGCPRGGALGVNLVSQLLRYYEALGDVQMLSTIVCVLRRSSQLDETGAAGTWSLLPPDQEFKYDNYIRKYADLLYFWNLLGTRAELNKHIHRPREADTGIIDSIQRGAGVFHAITCPRCGEESTSSLNFCENCRDFAFRCIICEEAVRGLFTSCESCGHGGHVNHLTRWFSGHRFCPTGCGCVCSLEKNPGLPPSMSLIH